MIGNAFHLKSIIWRINEVSEDYSEISIKELFVCIWERIWIVLISTLVFGVAAFFITKFAITPQYEAKIRLYVNNKTESASSLTSSDVSAAKSLVDTYITIIESNSVIDEIIKNTEYDYATGQIREMLSAKSVNGTEVFEVSIQGPSPEECAVIANLVADIAPNKISEIVEGSSVKIVDRAKVDPVPIAPNMKKNVVIGCFLGFIISCMVVVLLHMFDTTIYDEDDLKQCCTLPILGIFSDFNQASQGNKRNTYYGRRSAK